MRARTIRITRALLTLCVLPSLLCLLQCGPSCGELDESAGEETKALIDTMDLSCTTDGDCVVEVVQTRCAPSPCGPRRVAVSGADLQRVQSELQQISAKYCQPYDDAGCHGTPSECLPFGKYIYSAFCEAGACKVRYTKAP